MVNGFKWLLEHIPWFLFLILVFLAGWRAKGRLRTGVLYAAILSLVGIVGFWDEMDTHPLHRRLPASCLPFFWDSLSEY